ncbi:leucine-rich repeat and immunoglobulin-like domain-containing nogo receptor-interacting protein 2 [Petromyzon marinus]|uniref:leucine-rich repeat and immunoglobulin-like domain-containing nogo receptor-interacting protein 2 n=1 Tax=Petromyzon marinus TaxID=7757 RepID=UPI003F71B756
MFSLGARRLASDSCPRAFLPCVLLAMAALLTTGRCCPPRCDCDVLEKSVVCHRRRLSAIPEGIPSETRVLDLSKNRLKCVDTDDFAAFPELEELELNENVIATVEPGAFNNLPYLQSLRLRSNRLRLLQIGTFDGLTNLTHLDISENKIVILLDYVFQDLVSLRKLEVGDNDLVYISHQAFSGLQSLEELTVEKCNLTAVPTEALTHLTSLLKLRLRYLNIATLQDYSFRKLFQLQMLEIDNWPMLERLSKNSLYGLNVTSLTVTNTNLSAVPSDALRPLQYLRFLNLSYNPLGTIKADAFETLRHLRHLCIAEAQLSSIDPYAFRGLAEMKIVNVSGNNLMTLEEKAFHSVDVLDALYINENPLVCDCRLLWLTKRLYMLRFDDSPPVCYTADYLQDIEFGSVASNKFLPYFVCKKPRIVGPKQRTYSVKEGQIVKLSCAAEGDPAPRKSWELPQRRAAPAPTRRNGRLSLLPDGSLQIRHAQLQDGGRYTCVASNVAGNDSATVHLLVGGSGLGSGNGSLLAHAVADMAAGNGSGGGGGGAGGATGGRGGLGFPLDLTTILVATAMGCFTFLGVVLFCLLILFLWSRGKGKHKTNVEIEYVPPRKPDEYMLDATRPRRYNMKMI